MQQINLLDSLPKNKLPLLRGWHVGVVGAVIGALLIVWSINGYHQKSMLKKKMTTLLATQKNLNEQLIALSKVSQTQNKAELESQVKLVRVLNSKQIFSSKKFVQYLQVLADVTPNNLWITQLSADNTANDLTIQGEAYQAFAVLNYVALLNQTALFKQQSFTVATLTQTDDKPPKIIYAIQTQRS